MNKVTSIKVIGINKALAALFIGVLIFALLSRISNDIERLITVLLPYYALSMISLLELKIEEKT